jgi:MYXO-CTERM domain-containing protein
MGGSEMTFVTRIAGAAALGAAMVIGSSLSAQAGYVVTLEQQGPNVVANGSGSIDLTGLGSAVTGFTSPARMIPSAGIITTGPAVLGTPFDLYAPSPGVITGPTSFGSGGDTLATSGSGDPVGFAGMADVLPVPVGYVSDNPLSSSATWDNASFSNLGVTPGSYEWTWGTGPNQNFTLDIIAAAVPEPSVLSELAVGLAGMALAGLWQRRRRT